MIYKFRLKNESGVENEFYLTADSARQLYSRVAYTYGCSKEDLTLLAEYKEVGLDGYELVKSYETHEEEKKMDQKVVDKAKELIKNKKYRTGDAKTDYITRHNMKTCVINAESDLYPLIENYKTVKVYFEPGEKRGTRVHYAVYK